MLRSEESKASAVILLTWVIIMPIIIVKLFSEFAIWALALFGLVLLGMLASFLYSRKSRTFEGLSKDERTEKFSLKASRNGFFMAVALTALLIVLTWLGSYMGTIDMLIWVWLWAIGAYMLSYLYYIWKG